MPITSSSLIIIKSSPSIFTSSPEYLLKSILSPTLTSIGLRFPSLFNAPGPAATISPSDGFSLAVSNVLKHLNVNFKGINVLDNPSLREEIKKFSDWPTIPQLYIKGEFIGGCDIVTELDSKGELQDILKKVS